MTALAILSPSTLSIILWIAQEVVKTIKKLAPTTAIPAYITSTTFIVVI